jgi:hypothetical protein
VSEIFGHALVRGRAGLEALAGVDVLAGGQLPTVPMRYRPFHGQPDAPGNRGRAGSTTIGPCS